MEARTEHLCVIVYLSGSTCLDQFRTMLTANHQAVSFDFGSRQS